jgi:low temperature requirement protein LtrA
MRYQNESLMELIKGRYDKTNFWEKYGTFIVNTIFFILVALMFWLYFDTFKEAAPALIEAAQVLKEVAEELKGAIGGLDAIRGTGGVAPA